MTGPRKPLIKAVPRKIRSLRDKTHSLTRACVVATALIDVQAQGVHRWIFTLPIAVTTALDAWQGLRESR